MRRLSSNSFPLPESKIFTETQSGHLALAQSFYSALKLYIGVSIESYMYKKEKGNIVRIVKGTRKSRSLK